MNIGLQSAVIRQPSEELLMIFELSSIDGKPVQHDRTEDDPGNGNMPNAAPKSVDITASGAGIP